jgi:hypothetical protein
MDTNDRKGQFWGGLFVMVTLLSVLAACTRQHPEQLTPIQPSPTAISPQAQISPTAVQVSTPTAVPTPMPRPTTMPAGGLKLNPQVTQEKSDQPKYEMQVRAPYLEGAAGARVEAFNQAVDAFVESVVKSFKRSAQEAEAAALPVTQGSSLYLDYMVTGLVNGVLSVRLEAEFYTAGAAHPGHYSYTINYDVEAGKLLVLSDLFKPGADYLKTIADYCVQDLNKRATLAFVEGAQPKAENYGRWNLQPDGLVIIFAEYQVAPYAAGQQVVLIPYSALREVINPQGPLAPFAQ